MLLRGEIALVRRCSSLSCYARSRNLQLFLQLFPSAPDGGRGCAVPLPESCPCLRHRPLEPLHLGTERLRNDRGTKSRFVWAKDRASGRKSGRVCAMSMRSRKRSLEWSRPAASELGGRRREEERQDKTSTGELMSGARGGRAYLLRLESSGHGARRG